MKHGTRIHPKHAGVVIGIFSLMLIAQSLPAQTSIGFRDPQNIKPLLDYRLPDWGYKTLYADFSFHGVANNLKATSWEDIDETDSNNAMQLQLNPFFRRYRESENLIRDFEFQINTNLLYEKAKRRITESNQTDNQNGLISLNASNSYHVYLKPSLFVLAEAGLDVSFEKTKTTNSYQSSQEYKTTNINKRFHMTAKLGFGFGRVRNVTPLIQAMRFSERYRAIHASDSLSDSNIQHVAQTLSKYQAYSTIFDRPEKSFWRDLFTGITDVNAMSPFEFNYLAEALMENLGQRLQGQDFAAGFLVDYLKNKFEYRYSNIPDHSYSPEYHTYGLFAEANWYRNLNLNQQIGLSFSDQFEIMKHGPFDPLRDWNNTLNLELKHLYIISDRIVWSNTATEYFIRYKLINGDRSSDSRFRISSSLTYFIENHFTIRTVIDFTNGMYWAGNSSMNNAHHYRTNNLTVSINLKYYFLRGME